MGLDGASDGGSPLSIPAQKLEYTQKLEENEA